MNRERGFADWARDLDSRVLGRPVPDRRSLTERIVRPRPLVWSWRGRLVAALIIVAMFGTLRWWNNTLGGVVVTVVLFAALLLVGAADERRRAKLFYGDDGRDA